MKPCGTNYLGITDQETLEKAVRFASEYLELPPAEICEHHVLVAFELLTQQRDLAAAQELINEPDDLEI